MKKQYLKVIEKIWGMLFAFISFALLLNIGRFCKNELFALTLGVVFALHIFLFCLDMLSNSLNMLNNEGHQNGIKG